MQNSIEMVKVVQFLDIDPAKLDHDTKTMTVNALKKALHFVEEDPRFTTAETNEDLRDLGIAQFAISQVVGKRREEYIFDYHSE